MSRGRKICEECGKNNPILQAYCTRCGYHLGPSLLEIAAADLEARKKAKS